MDPQFRTVPMENAGTRMIEETDGHYVEAMVLPYTDTPDSYRTTWNAGWADDSLRAIDAGEITVPMVFGHDERNIANIVGSVVASVSTDKGAQLRMRFADFDAVPSARACHSLLKDKHLQGWSYKFRDGETVPDPNARGAMRFTRARLVHVSPVVDPSVPGTHTISVRDAGGNVTDAPDTEAVDAVGAALHQAMLAGHRSITITVGNDGTVTSHNDDGADAGADDDEDRSPQALAAACDAALDAGQAIIDGTDTTALPDPVRQALALFSVAGVAIDELLDAMGVADPDDDGADADVLDAARSAAADLEAERAAADQAAADAEPPAESDARSADEETLDIDAARRRLRGIRVG